MTAMSSSASPTIPSWCTPSTMAGTIAKPARLHNEQERGPAKASKDVREEQADRNRGV